MAAQIHHCVDKTSTGRPVTPKRYLNVQRSPSGRHAEQQIARRILVLRIYRTRMSLAQSDLGAVGNSWDVDEGRDSFDQFHHLFL